MTEKKGHYEKGHWVEDPVAAPAKEEHPIDVRLAAATKSVLSAMDDSQKSPTISWQRTRARSISRIP